MRSCAACGSVAVEDARFCSRCGARLGAAPRVATRKTVTILFCDVVGSTPLGEREDAERVRAMMTAYFEAMERVIDRFDVGDRQRTGDGIRVAFGVPQLHEDDALRAARCALEMRDVLARLNERHRLSWEEPLRARYGIASGEAAVGESADDGYGDVFNTAKRLESAAPANGILVGKETARLLRRAAELEPVEPLALKGKAKPVSAWRLLGIVPAGATPAEHVVGRDCELTLLHQTLTDSLERRACRTLTVVGGAGIGKSCLVRRFVRDVEDRAVAIVGRCLSYGEQRTFGPLAEATAQLAGDVNESSIRAFLGEGEEARQIAADVARGFGFAPSTASSEEIAWAFRRLLELAAARRPVIVIIEDIHWAEQMMLDLVADLVTQSHAAPLLVLCLARNETDLEQRVPAPLLRHRVELNPLPASDAARLLEWLDPDAARDHAVRTPLLRRADGNPFYLEQLVAMRQEIGTEATVPTTIRVVVEDRIDGLLPTERVVIEAAAIEGRRFRRDAVSEIIGPKHRVALDEALVSLVRRDLIRPDHVEAVYRFSHTLVWEAVYESILKARRAQLHQDFARWVQARAEDERLHTESIGFHYERAHKFAAELKLEGHRALGQLAARHLGLAGTAAFDRGEVPAAVGLLERATALLDEDDPELGRLRLALGAAYADHLRLDEARDVLETAVRLAEARGDVLPRAHALVGLLTLRQHSGEATARALRREFADLHATFTHANDAAGLACLWRLRASEHWVCARAGQAEQAWHHAIEFAARAGDEQVRTDALSWLASSAFTGPEPVNDGIERCRAIARELDKNQAFKALVLQPLAGLHAMRGEFALSHQLLDESAAVLVELGMSDSLDNGISYFDAFVCLLEGRAAHAELVLRERYACLQDKGETAFLADTASSLARAIYAQGRLEEAVALAHEAEALADQEDLGPRVVGQLVRAGTLVRCGQAQEALELTRDTQRLLKGSDWLNDRADVLAAHAEALVAAGDPEGSRAARVSARELYERKGNTVAARMLADSAWPVTVAAEGIDPTNAPA